MAVAVDSVSQGSISGAASLTISHTVGSGSNRALYVFVTSQNSTDLMSSGTVTYGGTGLGSALQSVVESGNGSNFLRVFRMTAPPSGTANVVITPSASAYLHAYCVSLEDVDQTTPEGTIVTNPPGGSATTSTSPSSVTVTLGTGGMALDMITRRVASSSLTPDGSQTRSGTELTAGAIATSGASRKSGSGSTTMSWTFASTNNVSHLVVPVNATPSADTTPPTLTSASGTGGLAVCSGSVSTNEGNGTLYAVATSSATAPTAAQVKAGNDHTGTAALRAVSQAVVGTGTQSVASGAITGGAGTRYLHFMHEDSAGNQSTVASSSSFSVTGYATKIDLTIAAAASLTSIRWAVFGASTLAASATIIASGSAESFDGSGNISLDITGTGVSVGAARYVVLTQSDGDPAQSPVPYGWHGPAVAS